MAGAVYRCHASAGHRREGKTTHLPTGGQMGLSEQLQEQKDHIQATAQGDPKTIAVFAARPYDHCGLWSAGTVFAFVRFGA